MRLRRAATAPALWKSLASPQQQQAPDDRPIPGESDDSPAGEEQHRPTRRTRDVRVSDRDGLLVDHSYPGPNLAPLGVPAFYARRVQQFRRFGPGSVHLRFQHVTTPVRRVHRGDLHRRGRDHPVLPFHGPGALALRGKSLCLPRRWLDVVAGRHRPGRCQAGTILMRLGPQAEHRRRRATSGTVGRSRPRRRHARIRLPGRSPGRR